MKKLLLVLLCCLLLVGCGKTRTVDDALDDLFNNPDPDLMDRFSQVYNDTLYGN